MTSSENENDYDEEIFGMLDGEQLPENNRIAVRYIRTDITASLIAKERFFFFSKKITVRLIDISSKGVAVVSLEKIKAKKASLELIFPNNQIITIDGKIIYRGNGNKYGLKFDQFNNELGNHLLATQTDLLFK